MAQLKMTLDTRESSKRLNRTYPISLRVFHQKARFIKTGYYTTVQGSNEGNQILRISAAINKKIRLNEINSELEDKLYIAKKMFENLVKA